MTGRRGDRGSVTAEFAVALPAVVLVVALCAATLAACGRQVRLQDAAADAARVIARGGPAGRAQAVVTAAVADAAVQVRWSGDLVCVDVTASAGIALPVPALRATSCALAGGL